jgi:hypothetical protein
MTAKERKQIREKLRQKKIECCRSLFWAKVKCRQLFRKTGNIHFVFAEAYGYVITNLAGVELFNQARKKNDIRRLRFRDVNKICIYRFPRKAWYVLKNPPIDEKAKGK